MAHRGVLFLDELCEFSRQHLEALRQPLEEHAVTVARARAAVTYPAEFMLVAASNPSVKVTFNHGKDPQLGDKVLGIPTVLEPDDRGVRYEVPLFDTSYNRDLAPGLKAGAYGSSFRFNVIAEDYNKRAKPSDYNPKGLPERTVREVHMPEFGPVPFPAYPGATAGMRSLTDRFYVLEGVRVAPHEESVFEEFLALIDG